MKREEHEGNRKNLHLASVNNTYLELRRDLRDKCLQVRFPFLSSDLTPAHARTRAGKHTPRIRASLLLPSFRIGIPCFLSDLEPSALRLSPFS